MKTYTKKTEDQQALCGRSHGSVKEDINLFKRGIAHFSLDQSNLTYFDFQLQEGP